MKPGEIIREYRKDKGWTQQQLAKKLDISRSYMSEIEHDKRNMGVQLLKSIAKKLDIPASKLVDTSYYVDAKDRELFRKEAPDYVKEQFAQTILDWENDQRGSSEKYVKDFFDDVDFNETVFKNQTSELLAEAIKFSYINQPKQLNDDPVKIRELTYIVSVINNYQNNEMTDKTQAEILESLTSILKAILE
ncbi:helix-turn-helix domain-containing protein [Companilactobacillus hulinensis]|uniref:helix-turn-helix domain-containing protein n=1 Tax=Companilactobacillus hulinensis TaxID=2486007 RepID=UPI000F790F6D|nr:helix-turn-helix transcriptional regulator [Companilactobacillus hulinensis]